MAVLSVIDESSERGIHNPGVIDLISPDKHHGGVVISMIESQAPESSDDRLRQIEEKFNSYLGYILDGYFVAEYPQYKGRNITIRFETSYPIEEPALEMFLAMLQFSKSQGLEFEVLDHTGPINLSGTENEN